MIADGELQARYVALYDRAARQRSGAERPRPSPVGVAAARPEPGRCAVPGHLACHERRDRRHPSAVRAEDAYDACRAASRVHLSKSHTSPRRWIEVAHNAPYVRAREVGRRQPKLPDHTRGGVTSFSARSQRRLMEQASKVDTRAMLRALFVTLTYPGEFNGEAETWKRDLDVFIKRVRRKWPRAALVWKLEFQGRGAPHYHFIILNVPYMAHKWVNQAWRETLEATNGAQSYIRTEVRRVKRQSQIMAYVSKYVAKPGTDIPTDYSGRFWGVSGRKYLPVDVEQIPCDEVAYDAILGNIKRLMGWRGSELDKLAYARGAWVAVDKRTKTAMLKPLDYGARK